MNNLTESSITKDSITLDNGFYLEYRWSSNNIWEVLGGFESSDGIIQTTLYKAFASEEQAKKAFEQYKKQYALVETLTEKINNSQVAEIDNFIDEIYTLRKNSLAQDGEYGIGNLVFKALRAKGYLDKLKDLKNKLVSKELSLEEASTINEAGTNMEAVAKLEYQKISDNLMSLYAQQDELSDAWDRADSNPSEQVNIGNLLAEISKKIALAEEEKKEIIKNWGYCLELDTEETLTDALIAQDIYNFKKEIQKYTYFEPIVQPNGRFDFYNIKESDADSIIRQLRGKDFVDYIQKTPGKYDFASASRNMGMPTRYYNVYGFIKQTK